MKSYRETERDRETVKQQQQEEEEKRERDLPSVVSLLKWLQLNLHSGLVCVETQGHGKVPSPPQEHYHRLG